MPQKTNNNYAFIDGQNLYLAIKRLGWKLDLKQFHNYLTTKLRASKAFYFIGYDPKQKALYQDLQKFGFKVVFKKIVYQNTVVNDKKLLQKKGNVDSHLIMQVVREIDSFHKAVVISGDGDFEPLYQWLHEKNKLHKIGIPNKSRKSHLLNKFEKYFLYLELLEEKLAYKKMGRTRLESKSNASDPS